MPPSPPGAARQRLITAAAGLGIAALAAAAFALSYDDLRVLALTGGAAKPYAPVYPVMIDMLVVVTILSLVMARRTRWWARAVRWLLLLALVAGAAAASAQRAVKGYDPLPDKWLSAGVAIAPWALLLLAVWLWLSMFRQARLLLGRSGLGGSPDGREGVPPSGTVRVMPTRQEATRPAEADQLIPGFAAPGGPDRRDERPEPVRTEPAGGRTRVPATLPTDIKLVTHRAAAPETAAPEAAALEFSPETTQPDLVVPRRDAASDPASQDADEDYTTEAERAEDPDAADDHASGSDDANAAGSDTATATTEEDDDVERWSALAAEDAERWADEAADRFSGAPQPDPAPAIEWIPPASRFRSSPTPPRD
jgi:hypothetical protein